jgi:hypothetical protein
MKSHLAPSGHQGLSFAFLFDSQAQGTAQLRITTTGEISFEGRQLGAALMLAPGYKKGRSSACEAFGNPTHVASAEVFAVRAVRLALPQLEGLIRATDRLRGSLIFSGPVSSCT